jgi:hypothetical protein
VTDGSNRRGSEGWTAKSFGMAFVASTALVLVFQQLAEMGIGRDLIWTPLLIPSLVGAIVLAVRHPGTWLLSLLLYFPSMVFVLYWLAFLMAVRSGDGP